MTRTRTRLNVLFHFSLMFFWGNSEKHKTKINKKIYKYKIQYCIFKYKIYIKILFYSFDHCIILWVFVGCRFSVGPNEMAGRGGFLVSLAARHDTSTK